MSGSPSAAATAQPHVLLVEDDLAIQRLVTLALEDEALTLHCCSNVQDALQHLGQARVQLVLTDLMLPGRSGLELLEVLHAQPALRAGACLAVFSAGLTQERRDRLRELDVSACFDKPMTIQALVLGVRELLGTAVLQPGPQPEPAPCDALAPEDPFQGDATLRAAYAEAFWAQWPMDCEAVARCVDRADVATLHRLAHNLKGGLRLLGAHPAAAMALELERLCSLGVWPADGAQRWIALQATVDAQKFA